MELESRKIRFNTPDNIATVLKKLENIVFKIPTLANINKPTIEEKTEVIPVIFNHVALNINIRKISRFGEGLPLIEIIIGVPKISDKIVLSSISITKDKDGEYIGETNIRNDYREIPGLGMALWELSQTTIQKIAVQLNKSITVVVNQQPSQGLSDNKWNKLFLPLLNKYGYKKVDYVGDIRDNLWERIYTPNHG